MSAKEVRFTVMIGIRVGVTRSQLSKVCNRFNHFLAYSADTDSTFIGKVNCAIVQQVLGYIKTTSYL